METGDSFCVDQEKVDRARAMMPPEDVLIDLSELYKVFGDSTRIRILYCLMNGELCVCDLASLLSMTPSAVSHQLSILKMNRLVTCRREGKSIFYSLADDHVHTILEMGVDHVTEE